MEVRSLFLWIHCARDQRIVVGSHVPFTVSLTTPTTRMRVIRCPKLQSPSVYAFPKTTSETSHVSHQFISFFFFFSTSQSYWLAYTDASAWSKSWVFKRHFQHNSGRWVTGYISIIDVISSRFHSSKAVWHFFPIDSSCRISTTKSFLTARKMSLPYGTLIRRGWRRSQLLSWNVTWSVWFMSIPCFVLHKTEDPRRPIWSIDSLAMFLIDYTSRIDSVSWAKIQIHDEEKKMSLRNTFISSTSTWRVTFMWLIMMTASSYSIRTLFIRTSKSYPFYFMISEMDSS